MLSPLQWSLALAVLISPATAGYSAYRIVHCLLLRRHLRLRRRIAAYRGAAL